MTSPYIQGLINESKGLAPQSLTPQFPVIGYDEQEETVAGYLGDLSRLAFEVVKPSNIFRRPVGEGMFRMFTNEEEEAIKGKISDAYNSTIDYLASPDFLRRAGSDASEAFRNLGSGMSGFMDSESKAKAIGQMVRGLLSSTIEAPLTLLTGKKIVDGEVVDATSPEMVGSLFDTAGTAAAIGTYSKLAKLGGSISAVTPGVAPTRMARAGALAKNIGREYGAQVGSGIVYEAVSNPDEFSFEAITNNIANPLVLATSVAGGALRTRAANNRVREQWRQETKTANVETLTGTGARDFKVGDNVTLPDGTKGFIRKIKDGKAVIEVGRERISAGEGTPYDRTTSRIVDLSELGQNLPPVPAGHVRMWHGGAPYQGGKRWLTSDRSYAEGYATKNNGQLQYVDVPRSHPMFDSPYPEQSIDQGFTVSGEFGENVVNGLKPILNWVDDNAAINADATIGVPSAKQIAVGPATTLAEAAASVDALSVSDNWIEAGIDRLKKLGRGTFYFALNSAEEAQALVNRYLGEPLIQKPKLETPPPIVSSKGGIVYYFADDFDNLLFQSDDLGALSRQYNIPKNVLKDMKERLLDTVKNTKTEVTEVGGKSFRYRTIGSVPLPTPRAKPRAYLGPKNEVLVSMNPLTAEMIDIFGKSGMFIGQDALINGTRGTFTGIAKNGNLKFRLRNGRVASATVDDITRIPSADAPAWSRRSFSESLVDTFLDFADSQATTNKTFDQLLSRFSQLQKMDEVADLPKFTNLVYKTLQERAAQTEQLIGPRTLSELSDVSKYERMAREILGDAEFKRRISLDKLDTLGYRTVVEGTGYKVIDINGRVVGRFNNLDELAKLADADFTSPTTSFAINPGTMPMDGVPLENSRYNRLRGWIREKRDSAIGQVFRRPDRLAEDLLSVVGDRTLGTEIGFKINNLMNGIDAATNGIFKPLVKRAEQITVLSRKVSQEVREQVTRALEQRSIAELAAEMTQEQLATAELLNVHFRLAGGSEVVKKAFNKIRENQSIQLDINVQQAVNKLQETITNGLIADEKVLRYIDVIESGVNMTADDYIRTLNWDRNARMLYDESKKFFEDASSRFNIPRVITGYAPWIQKWDTVPNLYTMLENKEGKFIHELQRLGLTEQARRVTDVNDLVYRYLKTGIHYKAPIAGGGTAGELLKDINSLINEASGLGADVRPLQQWVENIRGVPTVEEAIARRSEQLLDGIRKDVVKGSRLSSSDVLDIISMTKLGIRPILAARDIITGYQLASLKGMDVANSIFNISRERMGRINSLVQQGYLPQVDVDAFLSRTARGKLAKATDVAMKASLQPQVYKVMLGNVYITTFDKTMGVLARAKGDARVVIKELGDMLDSNTKGAQDFFLRTATRDPVEAARFLASRNAYDIANKFGRLNNPLKWQGPYGRIWGQFGSWSLNAATVLGESFYYSRTKQDMMKKFARLSAIGAGVGLAASEAGLDPIYWMLNPLSMIPHAGPVFDMLGKFSRGASLITSADPDLREYGTRLLKESPGGIVFFDDLKDGLTAWNEGESFFRSAMEGTGFKFVE